VAKLWGLFGAFFAGPAGIFIWKSSFGMSFFQTWLGWMIFNVVGALFFYFLADRTARKFKQIVESKGVSYFLSIPGIGWIVRQTTHAQNHVNGTNSRFKKFLKKAGPEIILLINAFPIPFGVGEITVILARAMNRKWTIWILLANCLIRTYIACMLWYQRVL
jgi:hypothetical protein